MSAKIITREINTTHAFIPVDDIRVHCDGRGNKHTVEQGHTDISNDSHVAGCGEPFAATGIADT